jgi:hypothetical protein
MLLAIALGACGRVEPMPDLFPETAAGQWHRTSLRDLPAGESPDPVSRTSIDRIQTATYQGPGKIEARVYRLTSPAVGLDVVQRWHPSADTVFFNQGRYFVVVKWQEAERQALQAFVRELEARLAPVGRLRSKVLQQLMEQAKQNATRAISLRIPIADLETGATDAEETGAGGGGMDAGCQ